MPAVAEADTGDMGAVAFDAGGLHAEMNAKYPRGVPTFEKNPRFPRSPRAP